MYIRLLFLLFFLFAGCCSNDNNTVVFKTVEFSILKSHCGTRVQIVGYYDNRSLTLLHENKRECYRNNVNFKDAVLLLFYKNDFDVVGGKKVKLGCKIIVEGTVDCYKEDEVEVYRVQFENAKIIHLINE